MNNDDQLRNSLNLDDGLAAAADNVDIGDPTAMLGDVRATVRHRRRRRQAITGVAAAGALAVSGVVLANVVSTDGSDRIVSAPATERAGATADSVPADAPPETVPAADSVSTSQAEGEPLRVTPSRTEALVDGGLSIEQRNSGGAQLFAWKGGFLALYNEYTPQPLPAELPESVSEQFPQEVQDLFADGLPPTIDEAITMLQDAGLYDQVADIVTSNPEVQEAIYGEQTESVTTVRSSTDGVEWSDLDVRFPVPRSRWMVTSSTGDRFVIVTQTGGGFEPDPDADPDAAPSMDIWSSTDLITWESQSIALPATPIDRPDFLRAQFGVRSVAVTDASWVISVDSYVDVDAESFLDDADRALSENGSISVGTSSDDRGVTIEIYEFGDDYTGDGQVESPARVITKTWAELGLDESPYMNQGAVTVYAAQWGGEPQPVETSSAPIADSSQVMATSDGFVAFGEELALSPDGLTWSPVAIPASGRVDWVVETGDGLLLSVSPFDGPLAHYRFDPASLEFTPVSLGDALAGAYAEQRDQRGVVLADYGDGVGETFGAGGSLATAEVDGYRFELEVRVDPAAAIDRDSFGTASYTLTDIATGEIVSTETIGTDQGDGEFEFAKEDYDLGAGNEEGFHLLDPETGEELVQVAFSAMTFITLDADGNPIEGSEITLPDQSEIDNPDRWLVASVGDSLIVEQLTAPQRDEVSDANSEGFGGENYLSSMATGSDAVILAYSDGSIVRVLPEG